MRRAQMTMKAATSECGFPADWQHIHMGDVVTLQRGFDLPVQNRTPGLFPVIGSNGVVGFHNEPKAAGPGVVIGRSGTIGKSFYVETAYWPLNTGLYVKDFHGNDPLFTHFLFQTFDFERYSAGVSVPTLNRNLVHEAEICIPLFPEQGAIAAVLGKIQAAVEVQDKIVAALKELKATTMAKLFREGLRGEPLKQSEIGEIPASWAIVRLGDYCSISSGGTPSRDNAEYWNGSIHWVKTGEIDYRPIRQTEEYITEAGLRNSSAKIFPKGTLLMAMYGQGVTRGKVAVLEIEAATNQACAAIFPLEQLDSGYLYSFCGFAYDRIRELGHGANQKNLSADLIREIRLPLPPTLEEQRAIYGTLRTIETRVQVAQEQRDEMKKAFSSALHFLMTGQLRVLAKLPEAVERFVAELVREFQPDRVVQFEPLVPGSPKVNAEVGLLVVMPFEGRSLAQAVRIEREIAHDFPLEVVAMRPEGVERAVEMGDPLIKGILERGRTLYVRPGPARRRETPPREEPPRRHGTVSEETLREIVQRVVAAVAPEKIILFGSAARGEIGPDSDIDLLVVKAGVHPREAARAIRRELRGVAPGVPKDVIVVAPEDVERDRDTIGTIIRPALKEGRVLYAA